MDILEYIKDIRLVDIVNNINSDKKSPLVHYTDDELDFDGNKEKKDDFEDSRIKKPNYKQNQKISYTISNTRYYNFSNYF